MKLFSKSLKPEEVINFLKENPDFFIDHPEAIEHLEIKHESGEAVSFIEKQVEFIKSKNLATSTQLKDFILNANANELLFAKLRKLISIVLSAEDLEKLLIATESFFMNECCLWINEWFNEWIIQCMLLLLIWDEFLLK